MVCRGESLLLKRKSNIPDTSQLRQLFACLVIGFSGLMNVKTMLDRQYQLSVIFAAVNQVIRDKKQIKTEMKMRFFIFEKTYQILCPNVTS